MEAVFERDLFNEGARNPGRKALKTAAAIIGICIGSALLVTIACWAMKKRRDKMLEKEMLGFEPYEGIDTDGLRLSKENDFM